MKNTYEELLKKYISKSNKSSSPLSFDQYKHENNLSYRDSYANAIGALYASSKRSGSDYGANKENIANKGLQNSGYSDYIDALATKKFNDGLTSLSNDLNAKESKSASSYAGYLEQYESKKNSLKNSVMSHLINNDIVDLSTAIAYGMSAGLSEEEATLVGQGAYEVTRQKVLNNILEQTASLGLDKEGAKLLGIKMGLSEDDAMSVAEEVAELLDYYQSISEDYLDFLKQRAD